MQYLLSYILMALTNTLVTFAFSPVSQYLTFSFDGDELGEPGDKIYLALDISIFDVYILLFMSYRS